MWNVRERSHNVTACPMRGRQFDSPQTGEPGRQDSLPRLLVVVPGTMYRELRVVMCTRPNEDEHMGCRAFVRFDEAITILHGQD